MRLKKQSFYISYYWPVQVLNLSLFSFIERGEQEVFWLSVAAKQTTPNLVAQSNILLLPLMVLWVDLGHLIIVT